MEAYVYVLSLLAVCAAELHRTAEIDRSLHGQKPLKRWVLVYCGLFKKFMLTNISDFNMLLNVLYSE
jgi:hypothetical protein